MTKINLLEERKLLSDHIITLTEQTVQYKRFLCELKEIFEALKNGVKDRPGQVKLCEIAVDRIRKSLNV